MTADEEKDIRVAVDRLSNNVEQLTTKIEHLEKHVTDFFGALFGNTAEQIGMAERLRNNERDIADLRKRIFWVVTGVAGMISAFFVRVVMWSIDRIFGG